MRNAICPICRKNIDIKEKPEIGESVTCQGCGITSIVVWLNPLELDLMYESDLMDKEHYE